MNKFVTSVLFSLVTFNCVVQADPTRPKLVVGIVVDQLRTDYVEYLQHLFGQRGFKSLMNNGAFIRDIDFNTPGIDAVSATAMIYTGSYPSTTGVPQRWIWNPERKQLTHPLADNSAIGNFTSDAYTPASLLCSTISDEVAIEGIGLSQIYSIAVDPQQAVIMAGHAGNSAVWLDTNTGKWATSSYYKDMPQAITTRNYKNAPSMRIDTMVWKPALPLNRYPGIPAQKRYYEFNHRFSHSDRDVYNRFALSPKSNEEITDIALDYLRSYQLGKRDAIDMINIAYTAAPFKYVADGDFRLELEDTYIRLDAQLQRLFDAIDKNVGLDNTLIYLTGTGYYDDATPVDEKYRLPSGTFSVKRCLSLLNSYLSAKYGNGNYVDYYHSNQIFLDRKAIEKRGLNHTDVSKDACDFVRRMSGVTETILIGDALTSASNDAMSLRHALNPQNCGDIYLNFMPGWNVCDDQKFPSTTKYVRGQAALTPAFIMGCGVQPLQIRETVDAARFAPSVTQKLRIRSPNGALLKPLDL